MAFIAGLVIGAAACWAVQKYLWPSIAPHL